MKKFIFLFIISLGLAIHADAQKAEFYGDKIKPEGAINTDEFVSKMGTSDSMNVKLKAKINEACKKKGCWMNVDLGNGQAMMVRFKDYGFFVPKDCDGRNAIMEGVAFKEVVGVDMLRHYAEDAGKSKEEIAKITEPETRWSFEANGVIIYAAK